MRILTTSLQIRKLHLLCRYKMLCSTSGIKCMKVVESSTPPPKDSKVITILLVDLRFPASSADSHWNFLAKTRGAKPQIIEATKSTAIDTPLAKTTPSVSFSSSSSWRWTCATISWIDIMSLFTKTGSTTGWRTEWVAPYARTLIYPKRYQRARALPKSDAPGLYTRCVAARKLTTAVHSTPAQASLSTMQPSNWYDFYILPSSTWFLYFVSPYKFSFL